MRGVFYIDPRAVNSGAILMTIMQNETNTQHQSVAVSGQPARTSSESATEDPGHLLALIGILVSVFGFASVGTVLSVVAYVKSKNAGFKNTLAIWGIVVGAVLFILGTLAVIAFGYFFIEIFGGIMQKCSELGPGTHVIDGTTYTCDSGTELKMRI